MKDPKLLEMSIDGRVLGPEPVPLSTRLLTAAILAAVVAGAIGLAFLALWLALILIPVAIVAAGAAWLLWRWRVWQQRG
jgi:hypothetical protein